jgi:hypothetical protein
MADPSDILLPVDAKFYSFVDLTNTYNIESDVVWSFKYQIIPNSVTSQHGFTSFLSTSAQPSAWKGHYIGARESSAPNLLSVAFDSTGLHALSSVEMPGDSWSDIHTGGALIIRDYQNELVANIPISELPAGFSIESDEFQTLRFRYSNSYKKLFIHYHNEQTTDFTELTTIEFDYSLDDIISDATGCGFSFCSPISSSVSGDESTFMLQDFHVEGNSSEMTIETLPTTPLQSKSLQGSYTTLTGVTANPI